MLAVNVTVNNSYCKRVSAMKYTLDGMHKADWAQVKSIYTAGLKTGLAAFSLAPPKWKDWDSGHLSLGRIVARDTQGGVVGWSALAPAPDT